MRGFWLALAAYVIWGCFPLYFNLLKEIPAIEVLSNRVIWSLVATMTIVLVMGRFQSFWQLFQQRAMMPWLILSSLLIGANWLIYIWAVGQGRVLEASLGYYMTPLVSLFLARVLLKEKLHPLQAIAGGIAAIAVAWELYSLGSLPWIPLTLALSFGFYGLVRKHFPVDSLNGLTVETLWLFPLALLWMGWQFVQVDVDLAFGEDLTTSLLLFASGILTAIPLLLFAAAAKRLDLSIVGFIMYINPTLQFLIAVLILQEDYPPQRLVTFGLVWAALLVFMLGLWLGRNQRGTVVSVER
ncbi:EamA family transporter RarD [Nitrincola tibetensis]|uniref:EamA family transporter RarD n=1 Tax=Nitrincola tibetensis TaxID=2219697 RepID=A0A364NMJ4_9GAMM|nr:EamA family transporter RarD [Nitrincola tibetensis]RAU18316.1 EamA family transporter RarD [Nitrincola tibetensis]